jgi:hypothetical protein
MTGIIFSEYRICPCMPVQENEVDAVRTDIQASLDAWKSVLLESFGERLKCAYAKGSSVKQWDSLIDYVPIISDVDIHFTMTDDRGMFPESPDEFADSMALSKRYEEVYKEIHPEHAHMPRCQLSLVDRLKDVVEYVPPRVQDVHLLIGEFSQPPLPSVSRIQQIDLQNLLSLPEYFEKIPNRVMDRAGLDFWQIIREMTWRVSPSPVRLLTQSSRDPLEVWSMNRTHVVMELLKNGENEIADHYSGFYSAGWSLFRSGFTSLENFRAMTTHGYYVLKNCCEAARLLA